MTDGSTYTRDILGDPVEELLKELSWSADNRTGMVLSDDDVMHLASLLRAIPPVRKELRDKIAVEAFNAMRMSHELPTVETIEFAPAAICYRFASDRILELITKAQ
jgi:hypothetical protein